jgi:hypothetical protein
MAKREIKREKVNCIDAEQLKRKCERQSEVVPGLIDFERSGGA